MGLRRIYNMPYLGNSFFRQVAGRRITGRRLDLCPCSQTCARESLALWTLFFGFSAGYLFAKHRNNCYL